MFAGWFCVQKKIKEEDKCMNKTFTKIKEAEEIKNVNSKLTFLSIAIIYFSFPIARLFFNVKCQTGRTGNLFQSGTSTPECV